ncbi:MAG: aminotransferase class V-fold PLP-dependent enzyme, partial [Eubacterium sp.]|nr:aminotransferase class V-fold PLP-dependent enzyme [Eubacterium sp.]
SLYESAGIIRESERNAAALFGAGDTLYSCGGSTLCIQGMLAVVRAGTAKRTIVAGRYSHASLVRAAALLGFRLKTICPEEYLSAAVAPETVAATIDGDTAAVFINAVDYYGGLSDIPAIAAVCRRAGVPLLADNAHGAYRLFTGDHPIALGADMVADSAHKTLPALTGAAYLHLRDPVYRDAAKRGMALFGSTSPSYLIMDSLDRCNRFLSEGGAAARRVMDAVAALKRTLAERGYLLRRSDPLRVTVDAAEYGYTGDSFAAELRLRGAEVEMSDERYTILLFSASQPLADFPRLAAILSDIPKRPPLDLPPHKLLRPEVVLSPRSALFAPKETVAVEASAGRVCASVVSPCPPCVPLVLPGERLAADEITELTRYGVHLIECVRGDVRDFLRDL